MATSQEDLHEFLELARKRLKECGANGDPISRACKKCPANGIYHDEFGDCAYRAALEVAGQKE